MTRKDLKLILALAPRRHPHLEEEIFSRSQLAFFYLNTLCDASQYVSCYTTLGWMIYEYASRIIQGRWLAAEHIILKDVRVAFWYAKYIIQGRWPEAEKTIRKSSWWIPYIEFCKSLDIDIINGEQ